jgi:oligopeptide transport system permease protein
MGTYILRRLGLTLVVVWGALTITFLLFVATPGNALDDLGGGGRNVDPVVRKNITKLYGLDKPIYVQYGLFFQHAVTWKLGHSTDPQMKGPQGDVNRLLKERLPNSLRLAFWGILVEIFFGISIGVVSAVKRNTPVDYLSSFGALALSGIPVFVLGIVLQYLLAVKLNQWHFPAWSRFPVQGIPEHWWGPIPYGDDWKKVVLPALVIASVSTAQLTRIGRSSLLEVLRADYMRTAKAKGLSNKRVILRHGLRNSLIPVITQLGIDLGIAFGIAPLTETVFNWPGLGSQITAAANNQDIPVALGLLIPVILAIALLALLVDLSYAYLDPRVRIEGGTA